MSEIDDFLTVDADVVDASFGTATMTCAGQTFAVVWDGSRCMDEGALGGIESDVRAIATAQPSDVSDPMSLRQKRCTVGSESFRISEVFVGEVAIHFNLISQNDSR